MLLHGFSLNYKTLYNILNKFYNWYFFLNVYYLIIFVLQSFRYLIINYNIVKKIYYIIYFYFIISYYIIQLKNVIYNKFQFLLSNVCKNTEIFGQHSVGMETTFATKSDTPTHNLGVLVQAKEQAPSLYPANQPVSPWGLKM